jgi:KDO2-lipid IV(A) lauroyltransferase
MRVLPLGAARALGSALGRVFYACVPYERKKTQRTLATAYPAQSAAWCKDTARAVFSHLGRSAAEFFRLSSPGFQDLDVWVAEVEGFEHLERPVREGRGVVAVTAHFGHWELLAAWVASRVPVAVVARQAYDARLDEILTARRGQNKIAVFGRNTSVRPILRWLKEAKVLGVLADQDTGVDSLYVEFFGSPSKTPSGPAVLAQSTGADIVCGFCFRRPDGRYKLVFSKRGPGIHPPHRGRHPARAHPVGLEPRPLAQRHRQALHRLGPPPRPRLFGPHRRLAGRRQAAPGIIRFHGRTCPCQAPTLDCPRRRLPR